jgi:cytochrome c oxidase subunit 2
MGYMAGHGAVTNPISALGWGLLIVSIAVFVITTALLILALIRRRRVQGADETGRLPIGNSSGGLSWIYVGVGISTVVLFGCAVWTMIVLAAVAGPSSPPALTLEVRGHMWWWEVRYMSGDPSQIFTTANEIHIPVGRPVRVRLISDDVIHAFWVPALAGKMQMIPGQTNETWLQAGEPGIYRGQCTQFCGAQHAKMAFSVVAQPEAQFEAWRTAQLVAAAPPAPGPLADGEALFARRCGACHGIRGTETGGILGPDLSHLMTRGAIAADSLPNDPEHLVVWIAHPQAVKPGNQMPDIDLSDPDLHAIAVYLESLK